MTGVPYTFATATSPIPFSQLDSNFNTTLTIGSTSVGLGNSTASLANVSLTGSTSIAGANITAALTYGGVTLSNAVTGTGNMVLSASPTITGTITAASANFSGAITAANISATNPVATGSVSGSMRIDSAGAAGYELRFLTSANALSGATLDKLSLASGLTYGGVTLSNSVTGTGSMVLSASPTLTGVLTAAAANFTGPVVMPSSSQVTASGTSTAFNIDNTASVPTLIFFTSKTSGGTAQRWDIGENVFGDGSFDIYDRTNSRSVATWNRTNGRLQMPQYGAGTATFDASGNITSVSDPSQKIITGTYTDGLAAIVAASSDEFMGWHKWRPESGMETEGTYASFFARDNFPVSGAVTKNGDRPNSFNDRPVVMALVNAVAELKAEIEALKGTH